MKYIVLTFFLFPLIVPAQRKKITLEEVYLHPAFTAETVPGFHTLNDGKYYSEKSEKGLLKQDLVTGQTVSTLINATDVQDEKGTLLPLDDIEWSNDEKKALIFTAREKIYRRSSKAMVYAYNLGSRKTVKIDEEKILHATYSPDGNRVAYVKNNNLYFKDLQSGATTQVTKDGKWNNIINGNCDWVYEEEFEFSRAFQWSKNGTYLAYYKFNETKVPEFQMTVYDSLYPSIYSYKYPKAGEPNSIIEIHIYNLATGKDVKADIGNENDVYIPRIKWTEVDHQLGIALLNRLQNHLKWFSSDANTGTSVTFYEETNKYYVEINDDLTFLKDGKQFMTTSERGGFKQVYLGQLNGSRLTPLTSPLFDVDQVVGINEKTNTLFYTAAVASPMDRQLYSINYSGKKINPVRVTNGWGTHRITMNKDCSYFVDSYSDINTPPTVGIYTGAGKLVKMLKDNVALKKRMSEYEISKAIFIKVPNAKGDSLNAWMLKPPDFDPGKKYPVLVCNYGGPGSQRVTDSWGAVTFWHQYLAQHGYIVASVDNTGTGFRGEEFKKKTYLQLGKLEIEDQIDAAKYLGSLPFVDKTRIGHWGWSYGGFMSSLAITKGADVFKAAIAVAPVTSWRFYDNIYTERFMRTPQENPKGYDDNSPLNYTDRIRGKFLIIHGTGDDNVHFQNSVMMVNRMIENDIQFESAYYPNRTHSISGGNTTYHIYKKMTDFILKNL